MPHFVETKVRLTKQYYWKMRYFFYNFVGPFIDSKSHTYVKTSNSLCCE
jgi:hypothetical protein